MKLHGLKGYKQSKEHIEKRAKAHRGMKMSEATRLKMSISSKLVGKGWKKGRKRRSRFGSENSNWKGGKSNYRQAISNSPEYKRWRTSVYQRDNYTCVFCKRKGVRLNADHIKPFLYFPDLRLSIDNGRTLCVECHRKTDTYGRNIKKIKL